MKYQDLDPEAIDKVLTAPQYWCAEGVLKTEDLELDTTPGADAVIRCIRDAYKDGEAE